MNKQWDGMISIWWIEIKFKYLGSGITNNGKCDTDIRRYIGIAKDGFRKLNKETGEFREKLRKENWTVL